MSDDDDETYNNYTNKITLFDSCSDSDDETEKNKIFAKHYDKIDDIKKLNVQKTEIPWVEKYRPDTLNDIVDHDEIKLFLKNTIKSGDFPHLLFFGPPGTGKTSTVHAIARELFGPYIVSERVKELNASDDRGISTVRDKIISFAKISIGSKDPNYPCPDFKIVILDEADSMTKEAQAALRQVMEDKSSITRFCFICNYVNKIIDPIISRCTPFKFKPIKKESIFKKIKYIAEQENINVSDECLYAFIENSNGDGRRTIMGLQNLKYLIKYKKNITVEYINKMNGCLDYDDFKDFWEIVSKNKTNNGIKLLANKLHREGYIVKNILNYLMKCLIDDENINDKIKSKILLELCNTDKKLSEGCSEYLQLFNILNFTNYTLCYEK